MSNIIGIDVGKMSLDCAWLRDFLLKSMAFMLDRTNQNVRRSRIAHRVRLQVNVNLGARCFGPRCDDELSFMVEPNQAREELFRSLKQADTAA